MHIAMVVASEYDVDARVRRQAESLVARGDSVTVIALGKADSVVTHDLLGVTVVEVPVRKHRGYSAKEYARYYARFAWHAMRELNKLKVDLVQVHSMPEVLVFAAWRQRLRGVPVLLDVHDLTSKLFTAKFRTGRVEAVMQLLERASFRFASLTMTVHEPYARMLKRTFGRAVGPCPVVMNVPDEARWHPRPWRAWDDDEVVFGFHGSLVDRYGVVDMLDAASIAREQTPGLRLLVRGDGEARPAMLEAIEELGLSDCVDISRGYVPQDRIVAELETVHIGLAPYRSDPFMQDSLPSKLLEYVAMEIPVICARLPYIEELFGDTVTWIEPGDVEGLAAAMRAVAADQEGARWRAKQARKVLSQLSWAHQRQAYLDIIDGLVPEPVRTTMPAVVSGGSAAALAPRAAGSHRG